MQDNWCVLMLMAHALRLCCRNVVHRDLKLENLLLATPDEITKVQQAQAQTTACTHGRQAYLHSVSYWWHVAAQHVWAQHAQPVF